MNTKSNDTSDNDVAEDFAQFVAEFAHGSVNAELSARLRDVVATVRKNGGRGKLVISMDVSVKGEMATVGIKVKSTKPEPEMPGMIFYTTEDGALATSDPRQLKLPQPKIIEVPSNVRNLEQR
jgi:hypothetical protein